MELFAITDSEIPTRIIKIDIDAPAQTVVENLFRTQRSEFINEDIFVHLIMFRMVRYFPSIHLMTK